VTEKLLPYDRSVVPQETGWWCGPASVQILLAVRGVRIAEAELARQIEDIENPGTGDDRDGTDHISTAVTVLNRHLPDAKYVVVEMPKDPPTKPQKEALFSHIRKSIDAGYGVLVNIVSPPNNRFRPAKGSVPFSYPAWGTIHHYVTVNGYDDSVNTYWVGDPGFAPFGGWVTGESLASLIPPKGYAYSTATVTAPPVPTTAGVLSAATGLSLSEATAVLPQVADGLAASGATTVNRIAMWLAQVGHESDSFRATEEYANGDESTERWRYKGRTWIQLTWRANYEGFSRWAFERGLVPSPTYFVDNPKALADQRWAGLGAAWYWTVARPQLNGLSDAGDLNGATVAINGGTNGLGDRRSRWELARAQGDALLTLASGTVTPEPPEEGFLMALTEAEQREVLDLLRQQSSYRRVSRSPLRRVGERETETISGFAWNTDGSVHVLLVHLLAQLGDPDALELLREIAGLNPAQYPERAHDRLLAQAMLNQIEGTATTASAAPTGVTPGMTEELVVPAVTPPPAPVVVAATPPPAPAATVPLEAVTPLEGGGVQSQVDALNDQINALRSVLAGLANQMRS